MPSPRILTLTTAIVAGLSLVQAVGCAKNKSSKSRAPVGDGGNPGDQTGGAEAGQSDGSDGAVDGSDGSDGADGGTGEQETGYQPKGGDLSKVTSKSKVWASGEDEPEWTESPAVESEVLALYKDGMRCNYRVKNTVGGVATVIDLGCEAIQCGESSCETRDIESQDVGEFAAAKGTETKCTQVLEVGAQRTLTTTVTSAWTHKDALREGNVVKSDALSCSLILNSGEEPGTLDACNPPAGRVSQKVRGEQVLESQTRGAGTPDLDHEANFSFKVAGSFADKEGAKTAFTACNAFNGNLSVTMSKGYCTAANKADYYSLSLAMLPAQPVQDHASAAYSVSLTAEAKSYLGTSSGACTISYEADQASNVLTGKAECGADALRLMDGSGAVSVSEVQFSCFAPEGYFD